MKKLLSMAVLAVCVVVLWGCSCSSNNSSSTSNSSNTASENSVQDVSDEPSIVADDCTVDYGQSIKYSKQDMDDAIEVIKQEFTSWPGGCVLHSISYSSDEECNTPDNIKWMNELAKDNDINGELTDCIMFKTNFHSPVNGGGAWEADKEYTDYQWWLARTQDGSWNLMTNGY